MSLGLALGGVVLAFLFMLIAGVIQVRNIDRIGSGGPIHFGLVVVFGLLGVLSGVIGMGSFLVYLFK